jgi:hypothetical protein
MPIQKSFTKTDTTTGDYWKIVGTNFAIDGARTTITVSLAGYANSTAAATNGVTPMKNVVVNVPVSAFTAPQMNVLRNTLQNWIVANDPGFTGGTIV